MEEFNYECINLFGDTSKPYSIVAYPLHKRTLVKHLIIETRKLSSLLSPERSYEV